MCSVVHVFQEQIRPTCIRFVVTTGRNVATTFLASVGETHSGGVPGKQHLPLSRPHKYTRDKRVCSPPGCGRVPVRPQGRTEEVGLTSLRFTSVTG